jgi:hypothetical protein
MKKGLSYVDWSISAGLFIIFIITIFVLVAPAFRQDYSSEYLNSIVQTGLEENISIELKKIPAFLRLDDTAGASGTYTFTFTGNLPKELDGMSTDNIIIYSSTGTEIPYKSLNYPTSLTISSNLGNLGAGTGTDVVVKVWIYASEDMTFGSNSPTGSAWTGYSTTFGVSETVKGIYDDKFTDFKSLEYSEAKENLNYPEVKDFRIETYEGVDVSGTMRRELSYTKIDATEKDKVNVLLWPTWLINDDATIDQITILIKTW